MNYIDNETLTLAFDQTVDEDDIKALLNLFAESLEKSYVKDVQIGNSKNLIEACELSRKTPILTHPIFSMYHSESEMMRYIKRLENKDLSLTHSMISLGSCTMKLNSTSELVINYFNLLIRFQ